MTTIRTDSWAAALTEEQSWELYFKAKQTSDWTQVAAFAVKEYGLSRQPSMSAFYQWKKRMRSEESAHRLEAAAVAAAEAAALAGQVTKDEALVKAFKSLATEAALRGDAKFANYLVNSAVAINAQLQKDRETDLKELAQATKDKELALAREKFEAAEKRLNAVQSAVKSAKSKGGLTAETLKKIEEAAGLL